MAVVNGLSLNGSTNLIIPEHGLSGTAGSFRINSTTKALEVYSGGNWIPIKYLTNSVSGGSLTTSGSYSLRTFTSSGTLTVSTAPMYADILVVGGGGGGGGAAYDAGQRAGGGGGAGAFITVNNVLLPVGFYSIVIGAGGVGGQYISGLPGAYSSFYLDGVCSIFAPGGHGGTSYNQSERVSFFFGGSGSGGGGAQPTAEFNSNIAPGSGYAGANAQTYAGGGGGGAGGAGATGGGTNDGGTGGVGRTFNGTYYAGGGGGGVNSYYGGTDSTGGTGGGGGTTVSGTANTGGGGGGGKQFTAGGNGGSGIVIVRYLT